MMSVKHSLRRDLQPLDTKGDRPGRMIFCRDCDGGAPAHGAYRDIASVGGIDLYCAEHSRKRGHSIHPEAV